MDRNEDVLGSYWTVAGPVEIHGGREWSLFDWRDRCAEAARVGMCGLGIWHADLEHQLERRGVRELKQIFDDHGLSVLELEFLNDWFLDEGDELTAASRRYRAMLFDAAAELDAHHIKVGNIFGRPCELARLVDSFGALCADAARRHSAPLLYELMPFDVNAGSLDGVLRVVAGAGADNGGIALDTWHLGKLGIAPNDLRRIPRRYLSYVELSDGMAENLPDLTDETINHRRLPGEGDFDIPGYISVLRELGYHGPWGVEVLSADLRALPIREIFDRVYESTSAQLRSSPGTTRKEHLS